MTVQVGQCGNQVSSSFWQTVNKEHGLHTDGTFLGDTEAQRERINVFYTEGSSHRYVARAVLVDLEPGPVERLSSGLLGGMFRPDNLVYSTSGAGNNWARGHYTEGGEMIERVTDVIR